MHEAGQAALIFYDTCQKVQGVFIAVEGKFQFQFIEKLMEVFTIAIAVEHRHRSVCAL